MREAKWISFTGGAAVTWIDWRDAPAATAAPGCVAYLTSGNFFWGTIDVSKSPVSGRFNLEDLPPEK